MKYFIVFLLLLPLASAELYYYAGSDLIAIEDDYVNYVVRDRLASNRVWLDSHDFSKTLPFGQQLSGDARYAFTGKEKDGSGLIAMGLRYYDANLGRFTSVDPLDELPYVYVMNNPMNRVDPTGGISIRSEYLLKFAAAHPTIAAKYVQGKPISNAERKIGINWFLNEFKDDSRVEFAAHLLKMYVNPEMTEGLDEEWYGLGNSEYWDYYPTLDISEVFLDSNFDADAFLDYAAEHASDPSGIVRGIRNGERTHVYSTFNSGHMAPFSFWALGDFSYYVEKGEDGLYYLTILDRYDFFSNEQSGKSVTIGLTGELEDKLYSLHHKESDNPGLFDKLVNWLSGDDEKTGLYIEDTDLEGLGRPFVVKARIPLDPDYDPADAFIPYTDG